MKIDVKLSVKKYFNEINWEISSPYQSDTDSSIHVQHTYVISFFSELAIVFMSL